MAGLDHLILKVNDLDASVEFYTRVLGFTLEGRDGPFTVVRAGPDLQLQLAPWGTPGFEHYAFAVSSREFDQIFARIRAMDLPYGPTFDAVGTRTGPGEESGARGFAPTVYFNDPNGHLLEIRSYDDPSAGDRPPTSAATMALSPMTPEDFARYLAKAVPAFAQDKIDSGQWSAASALDLSRQAYAELLPQGVATPEHFLFTLREEGQAAMGMLWYAVEERAGQRIAYVYDFFIDPRCRRMGHATRALEALEAEVASRGLSGIALHVFGHNEAARALYAKRRFRPTNIHLYKPVER